MKKRVSIQPEEVIVNLLQKEGKDFVDISDIFAFGKYIVEQLETGHHLDGVSEISVSINFDAIERTVRFHDKVFSLIGDRIYLRTRIIPPTIVERNKVPDSVNRVFQKFVDARKAA